MGLLRCLSSQRQLDEKFFGLPRIQVILAETKRRLREVALRLWRTRELTSFHILYVKCTIEID